MKFWHAAGRIALFVQGLMCVIVAAVSSSDTELAARLLLSCVGMLGMAYATDEHE